MLYDFLVCALMRDTQYYDMATDWRIHTQSIYIVNAYMMDTDTLSYRSIFNNKLLLNKKKCKATFGGGLLHFRIFVRGLGEVSVFCIQ